MSAELEERVTKAIRDELRNIGYGVGTINADQLSAVLARAAVSVIPIDLNDQPEERAVKTVTW